MRTFNGRVLLADEMGLGKTLQALWYAQKSQSSPVVIVCPASLKATWKTEAAKVGIAASVLHTTKPSQGGFDLTTTKVFIVNYDVLYAWADTLLKLRPALLIFDECHHLQNQRARRTRVARKLAAGVPKLICVSGTPLTNKPAELWPVLNMLWTAKYPSFKAFAARYCRPRMTPWGLDYSGAQNLRELHNDLNTLGMIRRYKKDVLKDLPERTQRVLVVPMSKPEEYERARTNLIGYLREHDPGKVRTAKNAMGMALVSNLRMIAARLKRRAMVQHFDQYLEETGEKIVISAVHHKMIDSLAKYYGDRAVVIDGRVPVPKRSLIVDRFQHDPEARVFIGQLQAAGTGLTLTAASTVWFAEMGHRPGDHSQMADRVHRIGQKKSCQAIYVVAEDTIETRFAEILQQKQVILNRVLDGTNEVGDFDIYDQLMQEMAAGVL